MKLHLITEGNNTKMRKGYITVTQKEYNRFTDLCLLRGRDITTKYNYNNQEQIKFESFLSKNRIIGLCITIGDDNSFPEIKYYLRNDQCILTEEIIRNSHTESPFGYWQTMYENECYSVDFKIIEETTQMKGE